MRTTLELNEDAYQIARTISHERRLSMGRVVSEFITRANAGEDAGPLPETGGFPTFRCTRRVTSEDVKALDDEA